MSSFFRPDSPPQGVEPPCREFDNLELTQDEMTYENVRDGGNQFLREMESKLLQSPSQSFSNCMSLSPTSREKSRVVRVYAPARTKSLPAPQPRKSSRSLRRMQSEEEEHPPPPPAAPRCPPKNLTYATFTQPNNALPKSFPFMPTPASQPPLPPPTTNSPNPSRKPAIRPAQTPTTKQPLHAFALTPQPTPKPSQKPKPKRRKSDKYGAMMQNMADRMERVSGKTEESKKFYCLKNAEELDKHRVVVTEHKVLVEAAQEKNAVMAAGSDETNKEFYRVMGAMMDKYGTMLDDEEDDEEDDE